MAVISHYLTSRSGANVKQADRSMLPLFLYSHRIAPTKPRSQAPTTTPQQPTPARPRWMICAEQYYPTAPSVVALVPTPSSPGEKQTKRRIGASTSLAHSALPVRAIKCLLGKVNYHQFVLETHRRRAHSSMLKGSAHRCYKLVHLCFLSRPRTQVSGSSPRSRK